RDDRRKRNYRLQSAAAGADNVRSYPATNFACSIHAKTYRLVREGDFRRALRGHYPARRWPYRVYRPQREHDRVERFAHDVFFLAHLSIAYLAKSGPAAGGLGYAGSLGAAVRVFHDCHTLVASQSARS